MTSVTRTLTRSSVELRPPSRQGPVPAFGRIVETTQGRPWDLEGTPSPAPQRLLIGRRGSQGPSVRPDSIAYFEYHMHVIPAGKGLNHPNGKGQAPAFGRIVETTQAREAWGPRGDTHSPAPL